MLSWDPSMASSPFLLLHLQYYCSDTNTVMSSSSPGCSDVLLPTFPNSVVQFGLAFITAVPIGYPTRVECLLPSPVLPSAAQR